MRLHLILSLFVLAISAGSAHAEGALMNGPKQLESAPLPQQKKMRAVFSTQAQLFVEQKEAPAASKTALRMDNAPRLSAKSKD